MKISFSLKTLITWVLIICLTNVLEAQTEIEQNEGVNEVSVGSPANLHYIPKWSYLTNNPAEINNSIIYQDPTENRIEIGYGFSIPQDFEICNLHGSLGLKDKIDFKTHSAEIYWGDNEGSSSLIFYATERSKLLPPPNPMLTLNGENLFVGVGTTDPQYHFEVHEDYQPVMALSNADGNLIVGIAEGPGHFSPQAIKQDVVFKTHDINDHHGIIFNINDAFNDGSGYIKFGDNYNHTTMAILNNGMVGIDNDNPIAKFQIGSRWTYNDFDMKTIGSNVVFDGLDFKLIANGPGSLINFETSGAISLWTAPSGIAGSVIEEMNEAVIISNLGDVGIGTRTPEAMLDVNGKIKTNEFRLLNNQMAGYILQCDNDGNASWIDPVAINDGDWILNGNDIYVDDLKEVGIGTSAPAAPLHLVGNMLAEGNFQGGRTSWEPLSIFANSNETDGAYMTLAGNYSEAQSIKLYSQGTDGRIEFHHENTQVMSIRSNHNVYIGTPSENSVLYVNGEIETGRIRTSLDSWPDNVFDDDYNLMTLTELADYISQHQHLPGIPSEEQVLDEGIDLGEMNALLLKKIEELTLHVIELEKKIDLLKEQE